MSPCSKSLCKHDWLVVYLPLWKILVSWDDYSQYSIWEDKVWNHRPAIKISQITGDVPLFKVALLTWYIYQKHRHKKKTQHFPHKTNLANDQGGHLIACTKWRQSHRCHRKGGSVVRCDRRVRAGRETDHGAARSSGAVVGGSVGV